MPFAKRPPLPRRWSQGEYFGYQDIAKALGAAGVDVGKGCFANPGSCYASVGELRGTKRSGSGLLEGGQCGRDFVVSARCIEQGSSKPTC